MKIYTHKNEKLCQALMSNLSINVFGKKKKKNKNGNIKIKI